MFLVNPYSHATSISYDVDAQAFFTASGLTDTTQKNAINTFVLALKSASIWTKMKALYPLVGGTADLHKWNLKDPQDTDAAYRIVWTGTITHNANGVLCTASVQTNWGDTKFIPGNAYSDHSISFGMWVKTQGSSTQANNSYAGIDVTGSRLWFRRSASSPFDDTSSFMGGNNMEASNVTTGMFAMSHTVTTNSGTCFTYHNGTQVSSATYSMSGLSTTVSMGLGKATGASRISGGQVTSLMYMSTGLTGTEITDFYNAASALQTALGR